MVEHTSNNIIYLNKNLQQRSTEEDHILPSSTESADSLEQPFQAIILKNRQNYDRLQRDRLKANKAILKSYRLK